MAEISNKKIMSGIPFISDYQRELDTLNNQLGKTTLTGKISSLDIAETLFIYMEETQARFANLQKDLIDSLVVESMGRVSTDVKEQLNTLSGFMETIMYKRGRDAVLLSSDLDIRQYLQSLTDTDIETKIVGELESFLRKFPFYRDVFIITSESKLALNITNKVSGHVDSKFLTNVLSCDCGDYISFVGDSTLEPKQKDSILYGAKVVDDEGKLLGAVVLSFDIANEMETITPYFKDINPIGIIINGSGTVLASTSSEVGVGSFVKRMPELDIVKFKGLEYIAVSEKLDLEDENISLYSVVLTPMSTTFKKSKDFIELDEEVLENSHIVSPKLHETKEQSEEINEDLIDVVINGEIIASKKRAYALNPILENIRIISERINVSFSTSIADIHDTVIRSKLDNIQIKSSAILRTLSRALFLQISDCKHIATIDEIVNVMSNKDRGESDKKLLLQTLEKYGNLNGSYFNIYAFDATGVIVGVSNSSESSLIGKGVENEIIKRTLTLSGNDSYSITELTSSSFYGNKETFVVASPIKNRSEKVVGGIAVILDYEKMIGKLLKKSVGDTEDKTSDKSTYVVIVNKEGVILSTYGNEDIKKGEIISISPSYFQNSKPSGVSKLERVGKSYFAIGSTSLGSYRTFKLEENKKNDLIAIVVSKI